MFGQSLLSGAFGTALVPDENFGINLYTGKGVNQTIGGKIKGAASFNGTDNYFLVGAGLGESGDRTRALWVYINTMPAASNGDAVYYLGNQSANEYYENLSVQETAGSTTYKFRYNERYDTVSNESLNSVTNLITGVWYHVALVFDGSSRKLYINGSLDTSATFTNKVNNTSYPLYLATFRNACCYLHGNLDQVRLYNTALNATQISDLYGETTSTANTLNFPAGAGCVAAYQFDTNFNTILSQEDLSTVNFPSGTTGAALYQFENSANGDAGPNPTTTTDLTYVDGAFGKAVNFNGSSSVWQSTNQIIESQQDFTISFWVKMDAYNGSSQYLWTSYATGDCGISLTQVAPYDRYFSFHKYNNTQSPVFIGLSNPDVTVLGQWYHLCGTFSTTTGMVFYVNGVSVGTDSTTWVPQDHGAYSDSIGCYGYTPSGNRANFTGQIDQFRAYQQTLTAAQVLELAKGEPKYNGGSTTANLNGWVNFKPDLTWIKDRDDTENHALFDANRGPNQWLHSNTAAAQTNYSGNYGLLSWENKGYTLGTGTAVNASGEKYVGWNWKAGADTYAGKWNGSSSKIDLPSSILPSNSTSSSSVSFWFRNTDNPVAGGTGMMFNSWDGNTSNPGYALNLESAYGGYPDGSLYLVNYYLNGSASGVNGSISYQDGEWHHIAVVFDISASTLSCYVDGNTTPELSISGLTTSPVDPWASGGQIGYCGPAAGGPFRFFNGNIAQFRIFNTALTQTQRTTLYNETSGDNTTLNFPAGAGCVAAYTLDNTTNDVGGTYNATPTNLAYTKPGLNGRNNDGTIESLVSANQDAGFSIVKYTGNGTQNATVGLGLGAQAELVIIKSLSGNDAWFVGSTAMSANNFMELNTTGAATTNSNLNYTINATTIQFTGSSPHDMINKSSGNYVAYCWTSIPKYSKIGSYTGNGSSTGPTVSTGFRPTWLMVKRTDSTSWWNIQDDKRDPVNPRIHVLGANDASAEISSSNYAIDFNDDGFQLLNSFGDWNASGGTYIYMTFA